MKLLSKSCRHLVSLLITSMFILPICVSSAGCPTTPKQAKVKPFDEKTVIDLAESIWKQQNEKSKHPTGVRVNRLAERVQGGSRIQPAMVSQTGKNDFLVCENECILYFIDEAPLAHFSHPVRILLIDEKTNEKKELLTEWWPEINGRPVFDKQEKRTNKKSIIFEQLPVNRNQKIPSGEIIGGKRPVIKTHNPCDMWAIIVCGYDDLSDTFDEDTNGIYNVLTGLGIPDNHIFYLSPHTMHPGVDVATSIANVQWAINQVAGTADETDKVLFFYSSHGGIDSLNCVPGSPGGGSISASDLDNWLDGITSQELTVVIEACHSGSLIGLYADGTYVSGEDNLTGDGETNRAIFTSASTDTSSYPDVDNATDPNQGDSGSETIWGYIEAFNTATADTNTDSEISFGEAFQYAYDNDVTRIMGWNTPQMVHTGLIPSSVYNYCHRIKGNGDLFICDGPGDVGQNSHDYASTDIWVTQDPAGTVNQDVVSGMDNYVHVAVHNIGTTAIANTSLKVYWADTSTANVWPGSFQQIGNTSMISSLAAGDVDTHVWTWNVNPSIGLGHHFCLVATADSLDDPITATSGIYVAPYDNNIGQINVTIIDDPGHGTGSFKFSLENKARKAEIVDLVVEWVGAPWGMVTLSVPDELFKQISSDPKKIEDFELVKRTNRNQIRLSGQERGILRNIELGAGHSHTISVNMITKNKKPGTQVELRLRQEAHGKILGAVRAKLRQVDPGDCDWATKFSVTAFSDFSAQSKNRNALEISKLFAAAITKNICRNEKSTSPLLEQALKLEVALLNELSNKIDKETEALIRKEINSLREALKSKDIKAALTAQGKIAEAVEAM